MIPHVERLVAPNPSLMTGTGTNTYVVGKEVVAVVDPGPDIEEHLDRIAGEVARRGELAAILVTHSHSDHLPGAYTLARRFGAPLCADATIKGVDRALAHGQAIELGSLRLRALSSPGHTSDHYCFWLEQERALFTGDLVVGSGTVVLGDSDNALFDYMASLEALLSLEASVILPGHGPIVWRPREKLQEYLDHRRMRESQVLQALARGRREVGALVQSIYADVDARLHPQAARNVNAHLYKLEREGRVRSTSSGWELAGGD